MPKDQHNTRELMAMANKFSGCKIDPKYFPVMLDSPLIIEPLQHIYILRKNRKLSLEDNQEIKQVFRDYFSFFAKQYNKKYLVLTFLFSSLMLFSGIGCIYLPIIFAPLLVIFTISLIICTCLINIRTYPVEITGVHDNFKHELFALKYNLNYLKDSLMDKYSMNADHDDCDDVGVPLDGNAFESENEKKTVSFSPKLKLCMFFHESYEFRSRSNSYENNGHLQHKG